jgi:hypothetical protein
MEKFKHKETLLHFALKRVEQKLNWFDAEKDNLSESVLNTWNNWHDLEDRLKSRLRDNYLEYMSCKQ